MSSEFKIAFAIADSELLIAVPTASSENPIALTTFVSDVEMAVANLSSVSESAGLLVDTISLIFDNQDIISFVFSSRAITLSHVVNKQLPKFPVTLRKQKSPKIIKLMKMTVRLFIFIFFLYQYWY